jgi:hypothetical protein
MSVLDLCYYGHQVIKNCAARQDVKTSGTFENCVNVKLIADVDDGFLRDLDSVQIMRVVENSKAFPAKVKPKKKPKKKKKKKKKKPKKKPKKKSKSM